VRKQTKGVSYFEVDDAKTLDFKKARLAERGIDAPAAAFIAGNYVAEGVLALLRRNGFDPELPSFFIWEGNTMYLTRPDVLNVLTELRKGVRAFSISFDYMDEAVVARTTGDAGTTGFVERFAAMGAPWHFGMDDLPALADEAGMAIVDRVTVADLHRAYWPGAPLASIIYEHYSLCTLVPA
jgi:O-methyltransferase involved in polyketide biosynthesis